MATYKICHTYDIGERSVFIESETDPSDAISYINLKTYELFNDDSLSLSNLSIANALVALYGCTSGAREDDAITIDVFCLECNYKLSELIEKNPDLVKPDELIKLHIAHHVGDQ